MPQKLKLAVAQARTLETSTETISALSETAHKAARKGVDLVLFPEAYVGGYPRTCSFGSSVGGRDAIGREQFLAYFKSAVDLGDTPAGAGDDWTERRLPIAKGEKLRGDGTREKLERVARESGVFIVTGLIERAGGSLYCDVVYVCPKLGIIGKRRKVMPTGTERLVWAQGSPSTLRAVTTTIKGVRLTLAAAICWENYMPLLRQSLYSQNVNLYLAPTADGRDTWVPLMRTIAGESRAFVLSSNQCAKRKNLPTWITGGTPSYSRVDSYPRPPVQGAKLRRKSTITIPENEHELCLPLPDSEMSDATAPSWRDQDAIDDRTESPVASEDQERGRETKPARRRKSVITKTPEHHEICWPVGKSADDAEVEAEGNPDSIVSATASGDGEEFVSHGGSCIISPMGQVLIGPLFDVEGDELLAVEADFEDCVRGRLDIDVAGHYSRNDAFKLTVEGLDLSPPP